MAARAIMVEPFNMSTKQPAIVNRMSMPPKSP